MSLFKYKNIVKMVGINILIKAKRHESLCSKRSMIGLPSSKGPYFMYFIVKNVSKTFVPMSKMVARRGMFFRLILNQFYNNHRFIF